MPEVPVIPLALTMPAFKALLQRGVGIPNGTGKSVREFLQDTLGIDPSYIDESLQTVFLDGHPVDDLDRAAVQVGAVLALSGAMPGLAGATLRRGGYYARLREGISHAEAEPAGENAGKGSEEGIVVVKLFNRPLADLAETLAARLLLAPADAVDAVGSDAVEGPEATVGGWVRVAVTLV